jgi:hypothetical protein
VLPNVDCSTLPVYSKPSLGADLFFVPCAELLSVGELLGPAFSEWSSGQVSGPATTRFIDGSAASFLAGGEFGEVGNVPCLLHAIGMFHRLNSPLSLAEVDRVEFGSVNGVISGFTKSLTSAWRRAAEVRRVVSPPRIFQAFLRNRLALYSPPPAKIEDSIKIATFALKLNVDASLLCDLHKAITLVSERQSVQPNADFVSSTLPCLHELLSKRDLARAGFSKASTKQLGRQKSIKALSPFYLKVRDLVAGWEALSTLVGVTSVLERGEAGLVCGAVSLPDSLDWTLYMNSDLDSKRAHRVRIDTTKIHSDLRHSIGKGALVGMDASVHLASLSARLDRASELAVENSGIVLRQGSVVSLCFRDPVTAKGALNRCQQMFRPPFSLGGVGSVDYLVSSSSLPTVELEDCEIFGGVFGDSVRIGINEVVSSSPLPEPSRTYPEVSGGMDLLTERVKDRSVNSKVGATGSVDEGDSSLDPWKSLDVEADVDLHQPEGGADLQPHNEIEGWGDSSTTDVAEDSGAGEEQFFLSPAAVTPSEINQPTGSLGVTADTLSEVFSQYIVFREANGMLAFGIPNSDRLVDYHSYKDNGTRLNAYVSFINDKYSAGFAPRSEMVSPLPVGEFTGLCDETLKQALCLCELQR